MSFFKRLSNGWEIAKMSFRTINENRTLLLFPLISTISLILVLMTFFGGTFLIAGDTIDTLMEGAFSGEVLAYALIFTYYLINYFIIVFFNAALIHCSTQIFDGKQTSLGDGISYATSKIGKIFAWAVVSATVGTILQAISNQGRIGEFVASLIGGAWSILTFFVVPIAIYEEKDVFGSIKESLRIMKAKWGESLGGNFSFGIIRLIGILAGVGIFMLLQSINPIIGAVIAGIVIIGTLTITAAAKTVFVAAVYNRVNDKNTGLFESDTLDGSFVSKR
jgi:hypothetical protein